MTPALDRQSWARAIETALADPLQPRLVFQPIVDLGRGVVAGYESLSRFDGVVSAPPDLWFLEAGRAGRMIEFEMRVVLAALGERRSLPPDTFLSLNVSPEALLSPEVTALLRSAPDLRGVVFEITEHTAVADYRQLSALVAAVREAGGRVAVDDAGAGYASLRHILELRPEFVKLDRSLVAAVDRDPAMLAVVQMLGDFTSRLDSWLIAEGIERVEEMDVLTSLGVPLGQGYLLGRPATPWSDVPGGIGERIRERGVTLAQKAAELDAETVAALVERRPCIAHDAGLDEARSAFAACPGAAFMVQIDATKGPLGLVARADVERGEWKPEPTVHVDPSTLPREAAWRAMQRPESSRFAPLICTLPSGAYFGVIPIERIVAFLAR